jgi:hypothetical protein
VHVARAEHAGLRLEAVDLLGQLAGPLALGAPGALDALEQRPLCAQRVLQPAALLPDCLAPRGLALQLGLGARGFSPGAAPALRRRGCDEQREGLRAAEVMAAVRRTGNGTQAR